MSVSPLAVFFCVGLIIDIFVFLKQVLIGSCAYLYGFFQRRENTMPMDVLDEQLMDDDFVEIIPAEKN